MLLWLNKSIELSDFWCSPVVCVTRGAGRTEICTFKVPNSFIHRVNPDGPGCNSLAPTHRAGPCGLTAYGINGSGDCDETLQPVIYLDRANTRAN